MAANSYTTSDLITLIKLNAHIPQSNSTFLPAQLLNMADTELRIRVAAILKKADEGYFQTYVEHAQNSDGVYDIPSAAIIAGAYSLQIRNGQAIWPVSRQEIAEMTTTTYPSVGNWACYVRGNKLYMLPVEFSGYLRITYERRPSKLVATTACAQISSIAGQVITVSSVPSGWVVGDTLDYQAAQPTFNVLGSGDITDITGVNITVDGDISDMGLAVGDFLCLENQTCVPQIPVEFHPLLAQRVVSMVCFSQGYAEKKRASDEIIKQMEIDLIEMITPRISSSPKIVNPSWGGRKPGNTWSRFNPPASGSS